MVPWKQAQLNGIFLHISSSYSRLRKIFPGCEINNPEICRDESGNQEKRQSEPKALSLILLARFLSRFCRHTNSLSKEVRSKERKEGLLTRSMKL